MVAGGLASPGRDISTAGPPSSQAVGRRISAAVWRGRRAWQGNIRGGEWLRPDSAVDAITVAGSSDATGIDKLCQDFGDVAAAHAGGVAQLAL